LSGGVVDVEADLQVRPSMEWMAYENNLAFPRRKNR
jgi:hypothetical protein